MASDRRDHIPEKINGPELRDLMLEGRDEKASVFVEPDLPPQQVHVTAPSRYSSGPTKRVFVEESADQQRAMKETVQRLGLLLKETLSEDPHWINAARAFVVELTPEQLRSIAGSPLIKVIRLNRRLGS